MHMSAFQKHEENTGVVTNVRAKLRYIKIERSKNEVERFNGICFAPIEPAWTAFYRLEDDPVEYWLGGIKAPSQRQAHSLALILLRQKGIDVRKT